MNGWGGDGWMSGSNEWMDGWIDGWRDGWVDIRTDKQTDRRMDRWLEGSNDRLFEQYDC